MPKFNDFPTLVTAGEVYYHLGYAVIPLLGDFDPDRPKVAAHSWSAYQQRLANLNEINGWFSPEGNAAALGIVTGRVSHLVVLDFDSADLFAAFRRQFPDLLETRTVQSAGRGLPHLYFHLPAHLHLASQKRQGVDLLSDGRYVVAPPTIINGQAYRITRGGMPRPLTEHDIRRIQSFVDNQKSHPPHINVNHLVPTPSPVLGLSANEPTKIADEGLGRGLMLPTRSGLHSLYHYWRSKGGRNEALFRTALYARDHGLDEIQTRRALTSLHVTQSGTNAPNETPAIRQREAYATIHSVFSRPPRIPTPSPACGGGLGWGSIPNSVREALMQRKLTFVVRTLEGLLQAGFREGKGFTADQALNALKGIVGRDSVYNALNALAPNGQPFFPQRSPSALPPASNEVANQKQPLKTKKCFFVTEKKSGIKKRGPKQRCFKMPRINDLCRLLGVKSSGSDPLTRDDLMSAHQTRMALHRELIKRRPAEYSRRWLANRLGVSRRTINTYNQRIPIHTRATYHTTSLSWANIDSLLNDEALAGAFIETLTGKKYPALRSIAAHLMAKGTYIRLKQRAANLYWYGTDEPPPNILPVRNEAPSHQARPDFSQKRDYESQPYPKGKNTDEPPSRQERQDQKEILSDFVIDKNEGFKNISLPEIVRSVGEGLRPSLLTQSLALTPDQHEALAQYIYNGVNTCAEGTRQMSLKNARKLATIYTEKNIRFALQRLQQRTHLDNPTGFFVTVLRSTARIDVT